MMGTLTLLLSSGCAKKITRIIDGDTVILNNKTIVRLIGIDAPEIHEGNKLAKDAKRLNCHKETVIKMGNYSKDYLANLVLNKNIIIKYDKHRKGKYGRTLGYIYSTDGSLINEMMINAGMAKVYEGASFKKKDAFLNIQKEAQNNHVGLWNEKCGF